MELDVMITRESNVPWGFELVGGYDCGIPLTIVKVQPSSLAEEAGLQDGDKLSRIGDTVAEKLTYDEARKFVALCGDNLSLGVSRGLYDPVLDDQEPLYDYRPEDFDQPSSEPTEVFQIQRFIEPPDLAETDPEFNRSLTSSPFVLPTKPYRPFSTEPLPDVPPLEDPIILNPNYRDEFGRLRDPEENVETKFKLPISEQYDPNALKKDGEGRCDSAAFRETVSDVQSQFASTEETIKNMKVTKETKLLNEVKTHERVKDVKIVESKEQMTMEDLEIQTIEETAKLIVEDSIERALSVAEEINKEINVDETVVTTERKESKELIESEMRKESIKMESEVISTQQVNETYEIKENVEQYETPEQDQWVEERKQSIRQEIEETIEEGSVKKKAEVFSKEEASFKAQRKSSQVLQEPEARKASFAETKVNTEVHEKENINTAKSERKESVYKAQTAERSQKDVNKTSKSEQRAYILGLQTIPNIRGTVHSSYPFDMLLKTFFIHLTDVMVALSRFILTEPALTETKTHDESSVSQNIVSKTVDIKKEQNVASQHDKKDMVNKVKVEKAVQKEQFEKEMKDKVLEKKETKSFKNIVKEEIVGKQREQKKMVAKEKSSEEVQKETVQQKQESMSEVKVNGSMVSETEVVEKKKLSGAKMAQLSERKSEELTQKMGAVISEFQTKAVDQFAERVETNQRRSRSSSRSRIEEEVMRENDPLDWLEKHDSRKSSSAETKTEFSSQFSESKKFQSTHESKKYKTYKPKPGKQMYVAIVESHVYTNRDAILEDYAAEMSETASISSAEETNVAHQSMEAVSTENVAFNSSMTNKHVAQSIVEKSRGFTIASAQSEATVQSINERLYETKEAKHEQYEQSYALNKQEAKEVIVQALQEVIEPVTEFRQTQEMKVHEAVMKVEESYSSAKQEHVKSIALAKTSEEKTEVKETKVLQTEETKIEKAAMAIEEEYSSAKKVYVQPLAVAKPTEINVEISETDIFESKVTESETAVVTAIEDFKSAEKAEVKSLAFAKTEELKTDIKEAQILEKQEQQIEKASEAIEEDHTITIEVTEPEVKKAEEITVDETLKIKRKKRPIEASAELKIVKYEYIEPEGVDVININEESELKIKENIEINKTLQSVAGQSDNYVSRQTESDSTEMASHLEARKDLAQVSVERNVEKSLKEQRIVNYTQEANVPAKSAQLAVRTDLKAYSTQTIVNDENNNTPSPTTVLPSPLTDEYVFKLAIPLPKSRSPTPFPQDDTEIEDPNIVKKHEDPNIVKKKLIPHIETKIESVVYDPPLPTPPEDKPTSPTFSKPGLNGGCSRRLPFYFKPGLRGGSDRPRRKEEIREIERKSSLLASAIDETIKSIEEYKEEVAMERNKEYKKKEIHKMEHSSTKFEQTITKKTSSQNMNSTHENHAENNGDTKKNERIIEVTKEFDTTDSKIANKDVNTQNGKSAQEINMITKSEFKREATKQENDSKTSIRVMRMKSVEDKTSNEESVKDTQAQNVTEEKIEEIEAPKPEMSEKIQSIAENTSQEVTNKEITIKNAVKEDLTQNTENAVKIEEFESEKTKQDAVLREVKIEEYKPEEIKPELNKQVETQELSRNEVKIEENRPEVETAPPRLEDHSIVQDLKKEIEEKSEKQDPLLGYRPVHFDPDSIQDKWSQHINYMQEPIVQCDKKGYMTEDGEIIGTVQGIVDGLEEAVVDEEVAKELGKPGMTEEKIAELISGESEMLREAHVMGLARVLSTHMHRSDDSSVDFKKIKPIVESLNNSEVLKALNEELLRTQEERKREEQKKWTTFLQKPKRPVPRAKFGYPGYVEQQKRAIEEEPYKVKIVKQPKPKVAPDYKPEDFETGPLPWEQRADEESHLPPVEPEEPILIPEEVPEFLEAVDPLPESEIPDLEDTGIPLPKFETISLEEPTPPEYTEDNLEEKKEEEIVPEPETEEPPQVEESMERNPVIDQLLRSVQSLVDPNAPLDQQLHQMRGQLAALAQLPEVIQQTLDLVTRQFNQISQQESQRVVESQNHEQNQDSQNYEVQESYQDPPEETAQEQRAEQVVIEEMPEPQTNGEVQDVMTEEEIESRRREEEELIKSEKLKKVCLFVQKAMEEQAKMESQSRQVKQRPTPRVGKPKRMFGPLSPEDRAIVLPGGRRWRGPDDAYNEQLINETLTAQSELIQGRVLGPPFESDILPYDQRINFMKYEKPPVSLDHLQNSEVYKMIHDMDDTPPRRVEMRTPVMCEADYRERVRSQTPSLNIPQQLHP